MNMPSSSAFLAILLIAAAIVISLLFLNGQSGNVPANMRCVQDSDCVPAQCCHPTSCINSAYKGVCNLFCTMSCEGPLDCGAGSCGCMGHTCAVAPK